MSADGFKHMPADFGRPRYRTAGISSGSTALGIAFDNGVMIAADTLVTYGSEKAHQNLPRVFKINENVVLGMGGDYPDFLETRTTLENMTIEDFCFQDPNRLKPKMVTTWLANTLYQRYIASKQLSFEVLVGGIEQDGTPYLSGVDKHGGYYSDYATALGGANFGIPLIHHRKPKDRDFTAEEASKLIEEIMLMLYYRNCPAVNTYLVAMCTRKGCSVVGPFTVKEDWSVAAVTHGY